MITVLYHGDDDGFGAAFVLWKHYILSEPFKAIPVQYNQPVPEIPEETKKLFIVDFSYDRTTTETLAEKYDLTVIDHHETAKTRLNNLLYCYIDTTCSGCILTWEFLHPNKEIPIILKYVQDRDLWKFQLPESKVVNLYIHTLGHDFNAWNSFSLSEALKLGNTLQKYQDKIIKTSLYKYNMQDFFGHLVPVVNTTTCVSEIGESLLIKEPQAPFVVMYQDNLKERVRIYSLRSRKDGFNVATLCEERGGGGRSSAAGFVISL